MSWFKRKAAHDKDTHEYLAKSSPKYIDWEIVTLFYSALHLVNTFLEQYHIPIPTSHDQRESLVNRHLHNIYDSYVKLYILSRQARYETPMDADDLSIAIDCYAVIKSEMAPIA